MIHIIKCPKVSSEFTCTYVKHWELSIDDLQLRTKNCRGGKNRVFEITNQQVIEPLQISFKLFKSSNQSLSEYFGRSVLKATKYLQKSDEEETFKLEATAEVTNPLIVFKIRTSYYLESPLGKITSKEPIKMSIQDMLSLYGIKREFDLGDIANYEENEKIHFCFYRLKNAKYNGRTATTYGYRCSSVPGELGSIWKPRHKINIG